LSLVTAASASALANTVSPRGADSSPRRRESSSAAASALIPLSPKGRSKGIKKGDKKEKEEKEKGKEGEREKSEGSGAEETELQEEVSPLVYSYSSSSCISLYVRSRS